MTYGKSTGLFNVIIYNARARSLLRCHSSLPKLMDLTKIFINSAGRLRSGWRLLIFVFVYVCLLFLLATAARLVYAVALIVAPGSSSGPYLENMVFRVTLLLASLAAGYICMRWLEGLPWRALGLWLH